MSNLIECIDCGHQVSKRAETCPKCGAPVDFEIEITEPLSTRGSAKYFEKDFKAPRINKKEDPNQKLIIVIVSIAVFAFLIWATTTDAGKKIWNSDYRECRVYFKQSFCENR